MTMCRRALDERTSLAKQLGEELRASEERRIANEVEHQDMEKELSRRYQSLKLRWRFLCEKMVWEQGGRCASVP